MTDQQKMDPETQAMVEAAMADENAAAMAHLQNRVIQLNVEVRRRDARLAELEQELAEARALTAADPEEGDPGA